MTTLALLVAPRTSDIFYFDFMGVDEILILLMLYDSHGFWCSSYNDALFLWPVPKAKFFTVLDSSDDKDESFYSTSDHNHKVRQQLQEKQANLYVAKIITSLQARHEVRVAHHQNEHPQRDYVVEELKIVFFSRSERLVVANYNQIGGLDGKVAGQLTPYNLLYKY